MTKWWIQPGGLVPAPAATQPLEKSDLFGGAGEGQATPLRLCRHTRVERTVPRAAPTSSARRLVLTTGVAFSRADVLA